MRTGAPRLAAQSGLIHVSFRSGFQRFANRPRPPVRTAGSFRPRVKALAGETTMIATDPNAQPHPSLELSAELIAHLVGEHRGRTLPALRRFWDYYRNELDFTLGDEHRPYTAAQQQGLPGRLTRRPRQAARPADLGPGRREIVIENDIAWRLHVMVDFMFGKPFSIQSLAADPAMARLIEQCLQAAFDANGGICFFQDLALLGGVYGHVDLLLRADHLPGDSSTGMTSDSGAPSNPDAERALHAAAQLVLETVEAPRAIPVLDPSDYRRIIGYVLHYTQTLNRVDRSGWLARLVDLDGVGRGRLATVDVTEVWTADQVALYHDNTLVTAAANPLGVIPVVHIQNLPQPFFYEGLGEVEPLIPLQDELNTRLSDRANRVTMQSFKMYLGRGIENFIERPVGPGQMWMTDNPDASIEVFGGDQASPSEEAHIREIRQAMDKTSGVTELAAGLIDAKVGNLTSENALRIVMTGLLAKTEKKRVTYGKGIEQACRLMLQALDHVGALPTVESDRRVRLHWPSPLPENQAQRLQEALLKQQLGLPRQQILAELGYACS
jgi:hypothetical protein